MDKYDKSLSESNISEQVERTPPNFVVQRNKRGRGHDYEYDFNSFRDEMKTMISSLMSAQQDEIKKIYPTLMDIKKTNNNIQNTIDFLAIQNDELKKKIEQLELRTKKDKEYITLLEDKVEDLQRESRKANIQIQNVPRAPNETKEDLMKMVLSFSNSIDCSIGKKDIKDIYRIQNKRDINKSPIIMEISCTLQKLDILKMTKNFNIRHKEKLCTKHLGFTKNEYVPIYVSEQLTARGARLYFLARDLAKSRAYKFCWTAFGRIYIRKDENSPIIIIKNEFQVNSLMQKE